MARGLPGGSRRTSGVTAILAACLLAGCGAYGPSVVQGSSKDTPLEAGIGQQFQKLVPPGTAVQDVQCLRVPHHKRTGKCKILMIKGKPDRAYTYLVSAGGHRFLAFTAGVELHDKWTPPGAFSGGY